jgi:hypothetical protein
VNSERSEEAVLAEPFEAPTVRPDGPISGISMRVKNDSARGLHRGR